MDTTKLNKTTKKAEKWINEYKNSFCSSVENFYNRCSYKKIQAENTIKKELWQIIAIITKFSVAIARILPVVICQAIIRHYLLKQRQIFLKLNYKIFSCPVR